jgi:hypothetical protein
MNLDLYITGQYTCGCAGDYDEWMENTNFDEVLEIVLSDKKNWSAHITMMICFEQQEKNMTVMDYILKNANPEQLAQYLDYIKNGMDQIYEKIPDLDIRVPTKSARSN